MIDIGNNRVKRWVKGSLPLCLFTLLPLFASCSEASEEDPEWADWQHRNEVYFEQKFQEYNIQTDTKFTLPSWGVPSKIVVGTVEHTKCILVDVLEKGELGKQTHPYYTDTVEVIYLGRLMPSAHYPLGYEFDRSYLSTYDPDVDVPAKLAVNTVVEGFSTALQNMKRGDIWHVTVPYQLGYGAMEKTGIPAYSTLEFEICLTDFWSKKRGDRD